VRRAMHGTPAGSNLGERYQIL